MPLFAAFAGLAILLVAGLVLSDWAEKRRNRQLFEIRARLRAGMSPAAAVTARGRRTFTRWTLIFLALLAGVTAAFVKRNEVSARATDEPVRRVHVTRFDQIPPGCTPIWEHEVAFGLEPHPEAHAEAANWFWSKDDLSFASAAGQRERLLSVVEEATPAVQRPRVSNIEIYQPMKFGSPIPK